MGDVPGQCQGVGARVVGQLGCKAECESFSAIEDSRGEGQLLGNVGANESGQHQRSGHVRNETPVDFTHRHLGVGMDDANVGPETDLDSPSQRMAVNCRDHGHRDLLPHPRHLLTQMGDPARRHGTRIALVVGSGGLAPFAPSGHLLKGSEIETGTERRTLPGKNYCAHLGLGLESFARRSKGSEHRSVESIALVRSVQSDICHSSIDTDRHSFLIRHGVILAGRDQARATESEELDLDWQTSAMTSSDPSADRVGSRIRLAGRAGAAAAGIGGALVAAFQLRHGIVPLLDTVTYWSGAHSVASGHFLRTNLAPSFSNFDAIKFLARRGSIPFVDFPVAYPLLAGLAGVAIGSRAAMHVLTVVAVGVIAASIVLGSNRRTTGGIAVVTCFAFLVPLIPAVRLVTQGTLSEPMFIAATVLLVVALARYRNGTSWTPVVVCVIVASLLRFLGTPLALLAGWEHYRRTGRAQRSLVWSAVMMIPAATNIIVASAAGGGHDAGWRGLDRTDVRVFVRSIGGWFDARQGDIRRTYFTTEGPSWWSWIVAFIVIAVMVSGVVAVLRRRTLFTDAADLSLTAATILTGSLVAGILGFDALVIADNRLVLPIGILVLCAVVWTVSDRVAPASVGAIVAVSVLALWGVAAVRPWNAGERFSDVQRPLAMSTVAQGLGVDVIISNDADGIHWDTGIPSAYVPMPIKPLTGETVDDLEIYRRLPCALLRSRGAIVLSNDSTFSTVNWSALDDLTAAKALRRVSEGTTTVLLPTPSACDE